MAEAVDALAVIANDRQGFERRAFAHDSYQIQLSLISILEFIHQNVCNTKRFKIERILVE